MSRPAATGRYPTRAELEQWCWFFSRQLSDAQVARIVRVSETTVRKILAGPPPGN
jgi:hypothetical protein